MKRLMQLALPLLFLGACQLQNTDLAWDSIYAIERDIFDTIALKTDLDNWGVNEYVASPAQTLAKKAGDCDDLSMLFAYRIHAELGVPTDDIVFRAVILPDGSGHMFVRVLDRQFIPSTYSGDSTLLYNLRYEAGLLISETVH